MSDAITSTPRYALPYLFAAHAQKEFFVNEAFARLDAVLHPAVLSELSEPPAKPDEGACYLVATGATGDWTGREDCLAGFAAGTWHFIGPTPGMTVWDVGRRARAVYNGEGWIREPQPNIPISGGEVVDSEARSAIAEICDKLRKLGVFSA